MDGLFDRDATAALIRSGKRLVLAGDEALLASLPPGNWIGGTIPYFMGRDGGVRSTEDAYVAELPGDHAGVYRYGPRGLPHIARHHPGHGFTVLLLPAFSTVHTTFARDATGYPGLFDRPLVGWISGVALEDVGTVAPKVFDGTTGESTADQGVAMHVVLPPGQRALVEVVNPFTPGDGEAIAFPESGFSAIRALVNGRETGFAAYLADRKVEPGLPLVTEQDGTLANVGISSVDPEAGVVKFHAPVLAGVEYRMAAPVPDFARRLAQRFGAGEPEIILGCHSILNYMYAQLEGRRLGRLLGPMAFGQLACTLLNQSAVGLSIVRAGLSL